MNYVSFYRKWRPQTFKEIIGQEYVVQTLENAVAKNRLSHLYIFCGPRGTGKTSSARILAKAINCKNGPTPNPCNKCINCISITEGNNVDVIEIDAASNRGINEIREIREKVKYLPTLSRKKVYIIDEVHMLTTDASNAFLKVLEEPPEHILFIMATTEPHKVLPTIMSRCQRFNFYPIPIEKINKRLKDVSIKEKISISDDAISLISKYADGSLRDADGVLEQLSSFGNNDIKVEDITSLLDIVDFELLFEITDILIEKNLNQGLLFIHRIVNSNQNLKIFVSEFLDHLYNLYVFKNFNNPLEILDISLDFKERYIAQSRQLQSREMEFYMNLFTELYKQIKWGDGTKALFKSTMVKAVNYKDIGKNIGDKGINSRINILDSEIRAIKDKLVVVESVKIQKEKDVGRDKKDIEVIEDLKSGKMSRKENISAANVTKNDLTPEKKIKNITDKKKVRKGKKGEYENDIIFKKWNDIFSKIKTDNVPLHAMFKEAEKFEVIDDTIYFYLGENKKWHKDHLNKASNKEIISKIIKEVTDKKYGIKFEIKENNSKVELNKEGEQVDLKNKVLKIENNKNNFEKDINKKSKEETGVNKSKDDIFDYIEKKFEIKE